jgi:FkbM family methyltransferase
MGYFLADTRNKLRSFLSDVRLNIGDVATFGPQFLLRHLPRWTGAKTACVEIPRYGTIHLRVGESDLLAVRQVFRDRQYDVGAIEKVGARIWRRYAEILESQKTPVIVDAGANIGAASLWFLQKFPQAEVVAIEPELGNLEVLRMNAQGKTRLSVCAAAIGSTEGFASVRNNGLGWVAQTTRAESGIPIITMASAFRSVKNGCPFIAKIDIEGFEKDLFSKNTEWLRDVHVVYIEPHDWMFPGQMTSGTFQRALSQYDFEIFIWHENLVFVRT